MLSFEHKRAISTSFPELEESVTSNNRYYYALRFVSGRRRNVAVEFNGNGNGYVLGTPDSKYLVDSRCWMSAKNLTEDELRQSIRQAINMLQTAVLKRNTQKLLENAGFLPLSSPLWRSIEIRHNPPESLQESVDTKAFIRSQVSDANGLYIYQSMNGQILYIGKAKPLSGRLWSHYQESFQTVQGDTKDNRWHRFFSSHQGTVRVLWTELEDEDIRKHVEHMLTMVLKPEFISSFLGQSEPG